MVVVFTRHGEKRRGESDPELTSWGRRMALETGRWLLGQDIRPAVLLTTPTPRTRQTAEELALGLETDAPRHEPPLPEDEDGLSALLEALWSAHGPDGAVVCVGHHPTIDLLRQMYAFPVRVPEANGACAIVLSGQPGAWQCAAAWPGRP